MIKRTSRNFKVPLVSGGQWKTHQTFSKWDPVGKRLVTYMCDCNPKIVAPTPPPVPTNFYFTSVSTSGDPGSGNFSIIPSRLPAISLSISVLTNTGGDASSWLSTGVANSSYIKVQKDVSNYVLVTRQTSVDNTTYWQFNCTIVSSAGTVNNGDTVEITYT